MPQTYFDTKKMLPEIIYVDDRTGSKEFAPDLKKGFALKTAGEHMEAADFAFMGFGPDGPLRFGIERKTLGDLVSSLLKNRLSGFQVPNLLSNYDVVYLLVEGEFRVARDSEAIEVLAWVKDQKTGRMKKGWINPRYGVTHAQLQRWVLWFELAGGGVIKRTRTLDQHETCHFINDLARLMWKPWKKHSSHAQIGKWKPGEVHQKVMLNKPTDILRVAASLPDMGSDTARKVVQRAQSIGTMISWEEEDWVRAGMTKGRAEKLVWNIWKRVR